MGALQKMTHLRTWNNMYKRSRRNTTGRRQRLVDLFYRMDTNHDRILSCQEVNCYLRQNGYDEASIMGFWQTFDRNRDGQITAEEYNRVLARLPDDSLDGDRLRRVFNQLDANADGRIDTTEVQGILLALADPANEELLRTLFQVNGLSLDAGLTYEQFINLFSDPVFV